MKPSSTRGILLASLLSLCCTVALPASAQATASAPAPTLTAQQAAQVFAGLDGHRTHLQSLATDAWGKYEKRIGTPLQAWSKHEVAYAGGGTVFYPFSGPDFLTVARMYPGADRYVLVAIQNARKPVRPERMPEAQRSKFESKLGGAWERFGSLGFFRTDDLDDDQRDQATGLGVTTILMAFSARLGYEVTAVEPLAFNANKGEWEASPSASDWRSVRLSLQKDGHRTTLDYIRLDLSDKGLQSPEVQTWIGHMAAQPVFLKAASHLLQEPHFSILRNALVSNAPLVVQDETGLDYTDLKKVGGITLYGNFRQTHRLFKNTKQTALAAAYKAEAHLHELPFAYSYLKDVNARSMQIARRQPKK
jgi:hypothetical protein